MIEWHDLKIPPINLWNIWSRVDKENEMRVKITGTKKEYQQLTDVTIGREYYIVGYDSDGDEYFIDDSGERNFACSADGIATYEVVDDSPVAPVDMITISKVEYEALQESQAILNALRANGVDNWEWYDEAIASMENE